MEEDVPDPADWDAITHVRKYHGHITGLPTRDDCIERLKIWCAPSFLDGYCYTLLATFDGKRAYLRKLRFERLISPAKSPFYLALESEC